ncbi:MAG TPA: hypothetical protein PK504_00050 [Ferruginibacter sp.]|nr:hypothetical protein [Ferruginibacter sp.]HRE63788.1 hypothetical protein [Ferruginibacter sp.]
MKKQIVFFIVSAFLFVAAFGCNYKKEENENQLSNAADADKPEFFPVTNYIKGQINQITTNPLKYTSSNGKTDSAWIKTEEFSKVFAYFLTPEIDSTHMASLFTETKFADKTLGTYTFTYEPKSKLPDDFSLQRWDVYVDFKTNNVKSIYLEKKDGDKQIQLLWNNKSNCKIIHILTDKNGKTTVEKEELIRWDF